MTTGRASRLAWALVALTFVVTAAELALFALAYPERSEQTSFDFWVSVGVTAIVIPWSIIGALVASRRPQNPIGWTFVVAALGMALSMAALAYAGYCVWTGAGWPGAAWAAWLDGWLFTVSGIVAPIVLFLIFPDGRFLSPFWRRTTIVLLIAAAANFTADALKPGPLDTFAELTNPIGVESSVRDGVSWFGNNVLGAFVMIFAISSLLVRLRRSKGEERAQVKWVVFTALVACVGFLSAFVGDFAAGWLVGLVALAAIPVAAGLAILKYRLYEIDRIANRTVVYGAVSALLAGLYFGIVLGLQQVFSSFTRGNDLAIAGSTLAVAALFRPARRRIQSFVDRRFYRRRYDAQQTLEAFSARLRDEVDLEALGADLGTVVHETMQPAHVSLWLRVGEVER